MPEQEKAALEKSLLLNSKDPWTHFYLGVWYSSAKDFPAAVRCYERGLALFPTSAA
jgi:hypothetical protein